MRCACASISNTKQEFRILEQAKPCKVRRTAMILILLKRVRRRTATITSKMFFYVKRLPTMIIKNVTATYSSRDPKPCSCPYSS